MTTSEVTSKILRGIELKKQIKLLSDELDSLNAEFRAEAELEIRDRNDQLPYFAGQSWEFNTEPRGHKALVSFPKIGYLQVLTFVNKIPHRYAPDPKGGREKILTPIDADIREMCGAAFNHLWCPFYKPAKAFEELARAMIKPKAKAERLLQVLEEPPQAARVKFDIAK